MKYPKYAAHFFTTEDGRAVHTTPRTRMMIFLVRTSRESMEWGRDQLRQKDQHSDAIGRAIETHKKKKKKLKVVKIMASSMTSPLAQFQALSQKVIEQSPVTLKTRNNCDFIVEFSGRQKMRKTTKKTCFLHLPSLVCFYLSHRVDIIRVTRNLLCILSW